MIWFAAIKENLSTTTTLALFNFMKVFNADRSRKEKRPIPFFSEQLSYECILLSKYNHEFYTMVRAFKKLEHYLVQ